MVAESIWFGHERYGAGLAARPVPFASAIKPDAGPAFKIQAIVIHSGMN